MAVVVHRRKVEDMYKDTDDIRENIINYEDEGGGEGDMTGFDMNVLRLQCDEPMVGKYMNGMLPSIGKSLIQFKEYNSLYGLESEAWLFVRTRSQHGLSVSVVFESAHAQLYKNVIQFSMHFSNL